MDDSVLIQRIIPGKLDLKLFFMAFYYLDWNPKHRGKGTEKSDILMVNVLAITFFPGFSWPLFLASVMFFLAFLALSLQTHRKEKGMARLQLFIIITVPRLHCSSFNHQLLSGIRIKKIWDLICVSYKEALNAKVLSLNCKAQPLHEAEWTGSALTELICSHHSSLKLFDLTSISQLSPGNSLFLHLVQYQCHFPLKMWQGADCFSTLFTDMKNRVRWRKKPS